MPAASGLAGTSTAKSELSRSASALTFAPAMAESARITPGTATPADVAIENCVMVTLAPATTSWLRKPTMMGVPAVALGTWAWGDSGEAGEGYFGSQLSESGLREVVEKAQSNGFTLWDTAVAYGMGRSETVLARALKGYDRGEYQLSTKFTPQVAGDGADPVEIGKAHV